ncbi:hypothetical protein C0Q70_17512 [Pomacea canaliculata]|uniref:Uncharacterized protein n=1 Tax=Pomacea canaliculata TaxID=400727 RepID=A0A2T7NKL9_POMCA|nr:transcriptional adapter 1-like [Pomacea canaliculata]PVD21712.1 hypothetical protein C0Q70_17512 [Pomacea canaliculata]
MAAPIDLHGARKRLLEELGDQSTVYFQNLASWFKKKSTKEDFDVEARRLLKEDTVHLHNEFLLAIIAKCQSISSSTFLSKETALQSAANLPSTLQKIVKLKRKTPGGRANMQQRFQPANPMDFAPMISPKPVEEGTSSLGFVTRDLLLPDLALLHGRSLVCAWETGLQDVQENVAKLIVHALEIQLKRVLSAVMESRSGYKLREKRFQFAMGCETPNPYLRQASQVSDSSLNSEATTITSSGYHTPSLKPSVDAAEQIAIHELATVSRTTQQQRGPISLFDLLKALQTNQSMIPSHSVYAPTLERVIHQMWHPSAEEEVEEVGVTSHQQQPLKQPPVLLFA